MAKQAVLLVNLGSPRSASRKDVREYLDEFLSDERVLDVPRPLRRVILNVFLLPFRPKKSAHAYEQVWTPEGAPLIVISRSVQQNLSKQLPIPVELAMRYGEPSIPQAIAALKEAGFERVLLFPQYPQYAMSSYETVVARVYEEARKQQAGFQIDLVQPFYADADYIDALYQCSEEYLKQGYDHLLFSYHGIPARHLRKGDPSHAHCLKTPNCCQVAHPAHATCYRHQCLRTTEGFVQRAGLQPRSYSVSYQSRLAGEPWLEPFTDQEFIRLGKEGVRKLLVITPAFVADCLETLEEIQMAGKESFLQAGGGEFTQIPCLNDHPAYIDFLASRTERWLAQGEAVKSAG